jgi:hypothetical protein
MTDRANPLQKRPDGGSTAYAVLAEFADPDALVRAAASTRDAGYRDVDAFTPYAVDGLAEAIGFTRNRVPLCALLGGIAGGAGGYFLQWYSAVLAWPIDSGGRPFHSWPAFIPATFELAVLGAALAAFAGFLVLCGLPRLNHPLFNAKEFDCTTRNRFFLCIRASDPAFGNARVFLSGLAPLCIVDVPS